MTKNTIKSYSEALEDSVGDTTNITDIDKLCDKITSAIQTSSEATIPIRTNAKETKPWVDVTFLKLIDSRNQCKNVDERLLLNKELKEYRDKIKNEYYGKKAASINVASEARNVEAEFRKMSDYSALNKSKRLVIVPETLRKHFEAHFAPRETIIQPEVENPGLSPHILPTEDVDVNESLPTEEELMSSIKTMKNNVKEQTKYMLSS